MTRCGNGFFFPQMFSLGLSPACVWPGCACVWASVIPRFAESTTERNKAPLAGSDVVLPLSVEGPTCLSKNSCGTEEPTIATEVQAMKPLTPRRITPGNF